MTYYYTNDDGLIECDDCGALGTRYDMPDCAAYCDQCGEDYCRNHADCCYSECRDEHASSGNGIHDYGYKPAPVWFGGPGAPYYLGFELEIATETMDANPIYEWAASHGMSDLFYVKEDGSVDGFEIVSHPMSVAFYEAADWEGFFRMLNTEYPLSATGRTAEPSSHGLHVHISSTAFAKASTAARWNWFVHRNVEELYRVARRRGQASYARATRYPVREVGGNRYIPRYHYTGPEATRDYAYKGRKVPSGRYLDDAFDRYHLVNWQNRSTVEVRAFKSTRSARHLLAALRFVSTTADFVVSTMQQSHNELTWSAYSAFALDKAPTPTGQSAFRFASVA